MSPNKELSWLGGLEGKVFRFIGVLEKTGTSGRYLPCRNGATRYGRTAELGFSCFALKVYHTFGWWDSLSGQRKKEWIEHIESYQVSRNLIDSKYEGAYVDPVLIEFLRRPSLHRTLSWIRTTSMLEIVRSSFTGKQLQTYERVIMAETKQAIATLAQIGAQIKTLFSGYPQTPSEVDKFMTSVDWDLPWGAGGQTASLAVFLSTLAPNSLACGDIVTLKASIAQHYENLADPNTGGYFLSRTPDHGLLVNGAMKVLTALDWLNIPIHYSRELIDTTLSRKPRSDGCHLVDSVYVLYRCSLQTDYKKREVESYLIECAGMIKRHHHSDGGFSFSVGQAQKWYYGLPISRGLAEGDLHGTTLLVWALVMIGHVCCPGKYHWNVIRP
tara:strand:+ start:51854 stop:53008 length:1155 start_codon:yes stop_codon:yes gene_type:complete